VSESNLGYVDQAPKPNKKPKKKLLATTSSRAPNFILDEQSLRFTGPQLFDAIARYNPRVYTQLKIQENMCFGVPWVVKASQRNDIELNPEYEERSKILVDLFTSQLERIGDGTRDLESILRDLLWTAKVCGFYVGEPEWITTKEGEWWLKNIWPKRPWYFDVWVDEFGIMAALYYRILGEFWDPQDFIYAVWPGLHMDNWKGHSVIEPIYQSTKLLDKNYEARNRVIHKQAIMPIIVEVEQDTDDKQYQEFVANVSKMESMDVLYVNAVEDENTHEMRPVANIKATPDRASQPLITALDKSIETDEKIISRAAQNPDTLGVTDQTAGSYAQSKTQFNLPLAEATHAQEWVSVVVNRQILGLILRYNYPDWASDPMYIPPVFGFEVIDEDYESAITKRAIESMKAGLLTQSEARQLVGYPAIQEDAPIPSYEQLAAVTAGVITVNEMRANLGLQPIEGGDVPRNPNAPTAIQGTQP
jgi:hypothetical protein